MNERPNNFPPRPTPRPRPPAPTAARPGWGWVEFFILSQAVLPALLFVPGLSSAGSPVRPVVRMSGYLIGVIVWVVIWLQGKQTGASATFPARPWLIGTMIWMTLSLAHPNSYSPVAALAQLMMYVSVLSPAMWATEAIASSRQINRVMTVLFLCNALSASLGVAQVFSDRFYPPYIPVASSQNAEDLKIEVAGRGKIFRPCGLSDSPGAAAPAGATAALIGLCFALRPLGWVRRAACVGLAFVGLAVIYYTQVRATMLVLVLCFLVLILLFLLQRSYSNALKLGGGALGLFVASFFWVARRLSTQGSDRFLNLVSTDLVDSVRTSRGGFLHETFTVVIWDYPLGNGMGWWGMTHAMFQNPAKVSLIWVEIMITGWIIDGGIPLLVLYSGAIVAASANSLRIALKSRDPDVSFWAAVVFAQNISTVVLCCSYPAFVSPIGQIFWLINAALHAADFQASKLAGRPRQRGEPRVVQPAVAEARARSTGSSHDMNGGTAGLMTGLPKPDGARRARPPLDLEFRLDRLADGRDHDGGVSGDALAAVLARRTGAGRHPGGERRARLHVAA